MNAIEVKNLSKVFADRATDEPFRAVDGVSFTIPENSFVTLLGPSGCGKTTILRMIAGFEAPSEGDVLVLGKRMNETPPEKRELPVVFQNYALFPHMTVFENVAYPLKIRKWKTESLRQRVLETLALTGLEGLGKRRPEEMSGGQQQRVALARALVSKPKIVLFDEPLSNLDAKLRVQMRIELKRIQRQIGLTAIYVTHDQEEAMALSDQILIMRKGKIEQAGSPEDIYFRPQSRFVADFIGKSNFVSVQLESDGRRYQTSLFGKKLTGIKGLPELHGPAELLIRPEAVHLHPDGSGDFSGLVTHMSFLGSYTICEVQIDQTRLLVERPSTIEDESFQVGKKVSFTIDTRRVYALSNPSHQNTAGEEIALKRDTVLSDFSPEGIPVYSQ